MAEEQPIRVLFVGYGQEGTTFLDRLAQGMAESGLHITLATFSKHQPSWLGQYSIQRLWSPPWAGNPFRRLLRLVWLCLSRFSTKRSRWLLLQMKATKSWRHALQRLNRYLPFMKGHWDLIYFPWNSAAICYQGLFQLGIPVIISCRGSQINIRPHLPGQESFVSGLQQTLHQAAAVHCVSTDLQQNVESFGIEKNKCIVIHPAVDPDFFTPLSQPTQNNRFTLISTGALIWRKSYGTMLIALKMLVDLGVDAQLHIIGDGPERQHILFSIHDLDLSDRVTLHGSLTPAEVRDQLQKADVFVLTSLSEGIANAVLEAMSCGLPVVTTDCGGMREVITDGIEGFVVPMRAPEVMADRLRVLALGTLLRERMGVAARKRVIENFTLKNQSKAFHAFFRSISNHGGIERDN